jgi:hypothetical protein
VPTVAATIVEVWTMMNSSLYVRWCAVQKPDEWIMVHVKSCFRSFSHTELSSFRLLDPEASAGYVTSKLSKGTPVPRTTSYTRLLHTPPLIAKMAEGKGTNDMSLRANRKTRAPTLAKRISGPIQKATSGLPGAGGKSYAAPPRPQAGGKVYFSFMLQPLNTTRD